MLNETLNITQQLTFQKVTEVTMNSWFMIAEILPFALLIISYLLLGFIHNKTPSGGKGYRMFHYRNYWIIFSVLIVFMAVYFFVVMYPAWMLI